MQSLMNKLGKQLLIISLIANIGVLAVFKYYNFLNDNLSFLLHGFGNMTHMNQEGARVYSKRMSDWLKLHTKLSPIK